MNPLREPDHARSPMFEHDSAYHRLTVSDANGVRVLRFERNRQSSMMLDDPFETDFEYPGYFHIALAVKPDARKTLVIGLGGGSVVKRMWRDYPEMSLDVVELDPDVVDVCRTYFELPDDARINVFVDDGRSFVRFAPSVYDIAIVDAFDDDHVPRPLLTEEFLRDLHDSLAPDGAIAYNTIGSVKGDMSRAFRSFHRTVANVWRNVWVFTVATPEGLLSDRSHNLMLIASDAELTADELQDRIANRVDGKVTVPKFEQYAEDLYTGPIRTGDVPMLHDEPLRRRLGRRRR